MGKIIGIDLGTTNSVVAVMEGSKPVVIANKDGARLTPSVVAFRSDGERLVGITAKRQAITNPQNTVSSIKRFMGRRHSEVQTEEKMVPYKIEGGTHELVKVRIGDKPHTPSEISAMILASLKEAAEDYLGTKISEAVITVPAYFNDGQRQATSDAGKIAGLTVKRIINEPTAASLAYGLEKKRNEKIAVFDLGGGTFDISILDVGEGVFEVKSTNGDTHLGGDDFDEVLIQWLSDEFKKEQGIDLRTDQMALQRLKEAAEKVKCELSTVLQTEINLPFITADQSGPKHLAKKVTRAQLERLTAHLVERVKRPCFQALEDARLTPAQIDEIVLVGGSTRMPLVQEIVKQIFGRDPNKSVNPDEVVAVGAAIQGGILNKEVHDILLLDVTPLSLGIETLGGVMTVLIPRNTTIPKEKKEIFSTADDNQSAVDIHVLQGERPMARDNRTLGRFRLEGIPLARRGLPQIEVSFNIDANGILNVQARDRGTGKEQSIIIKSSSGLSDSEIDKMRKEAEEYAEEDRKKKETIEICNQADNLIYSMEKAISEYQSKLSEKDLQEIEKAKNTLKKSTEGNDPAAIRQSMEEFQQKCRKLTEAMYADASRQQRTPPGEKSNVGRYDSKDQGKGYNIDDGVIDADFEVKD